MSSFVCYWEQEILEKKGFDCYLLCKIVNQYQAHKKRRDQGASSCFIPYSGITFFDIVTAEAIKIAIEFKNPLEIPISISSVSLICELSATSDETNSGELQAVHL